MDALERIAKMKKSLDGQERTGTPTASQSSAQISAEDRIVSAKAKIQGKAAASTGLSGEAWTRATPAQTKVPEKPTVTAPAVGGGKAKITSSYGGGGGRDGVNQAVNTSEKGQHIFSPGKLAWGTIQQGADQVVTGMAHTAANYVEKPLLTAAGTVLGVGDQLTEDGPVRQFSDWLDRRAEQRQADYQQNADAGGKTAQVVNKWGAATAAALPSAILAVMSAGTSAAGQATTKGLETLSAMEKAGGVTATVGRTVAAMAKDPQYWLTFAQTAGDSYEQAKADGAGEMKANLYGMANGLLNAAVEVGGGIQTLPAELQAGESALKSWISSMVDEGKEEVVQGAIERGLQNLLYQKKNPLLSVKDESAVLNPRTGAEEFLGGAVVGGLLGGGQLLAGKALGSIQPRLTDENGNWYDAKGNKNYSGDTMTELGNAEGTTRRSVNENGLMSLTEQEQVNLSSGKKNKVISTFSEAVSFVKNALSDKQSVDRAYMGKVPDNISRMVQQNTGLDIQGFGVMMNGNDVRHIFKDHGNVLAEQARGQIAVTADDIARIPEVVSSPDYVALSDETDAKGRKALIFEKQIGDRYITIQGVSDGKQVLQTDTLYIRKGRTRTTRDTMPGTERAVPVINAQGEPPQNSSFIKSTIPQDAKSVNTEAVQEITMPKAARSDAEIDGDLQRIQQEQAEKAKAADSQEKAPREIDSVKELVDEAPGAAENISGEDFSFAQQIQTKGVGYGKDLSRNLDAAAGGNKRLRERLRDVFERPMAKAKADYAAEVRSRVNDLKATMDKLGIKAGSRESAAVQWIGEGQRQDQFGNIQKYTEEQLRQDFPNSWKNIREAEKYFRRTYDEYIGRINDSLTKIYKKPEEFMKNKLNRKRGEEQYYSQQAQVMRFLAEHTQRKIESYTKILNNSKTNAGEGIGLYEINADFIEGKKRELAEYQRKAADYVEIAERARSVADSIEQNLVNGNLWRNKRLNPRKDYFHHFQEMESGFKGLVTLLSTPADIDAKLTGQSEFTKPKTKWTGFMQQRKGGTYVEDAVGGMLEYIPAAEYKVNIDPQIARGRMLVKGMADATAETRNANKFIEWYTDYVSDLAGKTNPIDRPVQKLVGRKAMGALRWLNSRVKSNAVMGNMRSAVAQFFNLPNATAYVKSPVSWGEGLKLYAESLLNRDGARDVMNQSGFLNERYLDEVFSQFDEGVIKAPEKFANWMLSVGDKQATKLIWAAAYSDSVRKGIKDPIFYADDLTRRSVAGRGIGEVPLTQKSQLVQLVAPFQVEVNNAWQLMKERVGQKDALGLLSIFVGNFIMNSITRWAFGFDVSYDPINALLEAMLDDDDDDEDNAAWKKILSAVGRQGGELINAMPSGALYASYLVPDDTTRENLFGEGDPTRFGTGNIGLNMLMKPVYTAATGGEFSDDLMSSVLNIGLPLGGRQAERLINSAQDMGWLPELRVSLNDGVSLEKQNGGASYSRSGRLRFPIDTDDPWNVAKGLAFGTFSTKEGKEYLNSGVSALSDKMTELYQTLVEEGISGEDAYAYIQQLKDAQVLESDKDEDGKTISGSKKKKVLDVINAMDLSKEQKDELYYAAGYKESTLDDAPWYGKPDTVQTGRAWDNIMPKLSGGNEMPRLSAQDRIDDIMPKLETGRLQKPQLVG